MFSSSATRFLKASLQRTQAALQHTMYDVTETLAEIQGKTNVKQAFEAAREQNHDRKNLWLTAYHNRDFIKEDIATIRDLTLGVMGCVTMGIEKGAESAKTLQDKLKTATQKSKLAQDIKDTILYTIKYDLGFMADGLATQKEALLESIRSVFEDETDIKTIRYLLDEEDNIDISGFTPVSRPSLKERIQQTMGYVVLRSGADSRLLAQWCENALYDGIEAHSQKNHSGLSQALATERGQHRDRNPRNRLQETTEAVATIREGWQALQGVFASQQVAMER